MTGGFHIFSPELKKNEFFKFLRAVNSEFKDFEDAAPHEAAVHAGAGYIVTRSAADFKKSQLPVFEPRELINALESLK
ncbi:hypothetical protein EPICR_20258 [Candidatus Desulfarcum epimagneticum]|uniref:Uncharacterized protein n=1 Tax=uncultured Desulfobacteraceae bacterium TaxID=218296 RepID=A0A484HKK6_9BACT|nr:hypothetical protein EPICR_20258 [uncultured Desulfobacteraceae bacterium]